MSPSAKRSLQNISLPIHSVPIHRRLQKRVSEARVYYRYYLFQQQAPEHKFAILCRERSGSKLLTELLDSHPDIHCDDDILVDRTGIYDIHKFIEGRAIGHRTGGYGCKLLFHSLQRQTTDLRDFIEALVHHGWKVIYLNRRNILRQLISNLIATKLQIWHETTENPLANYQHYLEPHQLLLRIMSYEHLIQEETRLMQNIPYLPLVYEDDLLYEKNHQATANRVFEYLGFAPAPVHSSTKKMSPTDLRDVVTNYDEIEELILQTEFARFLDEA